ncbi:hypothetical protein BSL78_00860 [Apostichopus japonicus]|uniref:Uncharacterized protein n=1 Tax=Stichopus japonicus TaxID=307972 RepID=A0A2G8LPE5_STIJA|nr:hypothetical protein BSL78_00860 [Apostichopus japonicus]
MLAYTKAESVLETCTLRQFLEAKKENASNRDFLEKINNRVVAINNISTIPAEALRNRVALIEMTGVVVADNIRKGNPVLFTNDLFDSAGTLHKKIASVVQDNEFSPALINATIETIINDCSSMLPFDVFLEKVVIILATREKSEKNSRIPGLFIPGTNEVNKRYVDQVRQIYDEIQPEANMFIKQIASFVFVLGVTTIGTRAASVAVAAGGVIGVAAAFFSGLFRK